eukprot:UN34716
MAVVCTIHQPSKEVFSVFDTMMLLRAGGYVTYFGEVEKMVNYFEASDLGQHNGTQNIADFALECVQPSMGETDKIFLESDVYKSHMKRLDEMNVGLKEPFVDIRGRAGWFTRYKEMVIRNYRANFVVGWWSTFTRFLSFFYTGIILGWAFWDIGDGQQDTISRISITFMCISTTSFNAQVCVPVMFGQRNYVWREQKAKMHSASQYLLARLTIEMPTEIIDGLCQNIPLFYM